MMYCAHQKCKTERCPLPQPPHESTADFHHPPFFFSAFKEKLNLRQEKKIKKKSCSFYRGKCACSGSMKLKALRRVFAQLHAACTSPAPQRSGSSLIPSMASSCKHAAPRARLTHGNAMPAFPAVSSSGGTCWWAPGDTAGTGRAVSLAQSGGLQQQGSKPPSSVESMGSHVL